MHRISTKLSILLFFTAFGVSCFGLTTFWRQKNDFAWSGTKRIIVHSKLNSKEVDFIDVEFVDSNNDKSEPNSLTTRVPENEKPGIVKNLLNKLPFFSRKAAKKEDEQMKKIDTEVDTLFKGTGLVGGLLKGVVKMAGKSLLTAMNEAQDEIEAVQKNVKMLIQNDKDCIDCLGFPLECGMPTQQSSSYINFNGEMAKKVYLSFPVQGSSGYGVAEVQASSDQSNQLIIGQLVVTSTDQRFNIDVSNQIRDAGGIIDVEATEIL